jgi:hypothetical protein
MATTFANGESNASVRSKLNTNAGEVNTNTSGVGTNVTDIGDNATAIGVNSGKINSAGLTATTVALWDGAKLVNSSITEDATNVIIAKEIDGALKTAYTNLYLNAPEPLSIISGTPESPVNFTAKFAKLFTYGGGSLTYNGPDAIIKLDGAVSMISNTNNVVVAVSFGVNGVSQVDTEIARKISTGADVGAIPVAGAFSLTSGDILDFFVDANVNSTITITHANFTIHELSRV